MASELGLEDKRSCRTNKGLYTAVSPRDCRVRGFESVQDTWFHCDRHWLEVMASRKEHMVMEHDNNMVMEHIERVRRHCNTQG